MNDSPGTRVLDAAANRALEGLRVVEDYARFVLDNKFLTSQTKSLRHELTETLSFLSCNDRFAARETTADVGTTISLPSEQNRASAWDVCLASCERVKQSLRSLEEFGKLVDPHAAQQVEALRYQFYTLEKCLGVGQDSQRLLAEVRLCVLVDGCDSESSLASLVGQLIEAGVPMIQLRDKHLSAAELVRRGKVIRQLTQDQDVLLIVNDRTDIAAAVDADGVHLGQDDLEVQQARALLGPRKLIGVSTHNIEQARQAVLDGANYLGVGPTFPSTTKAFDAFPGVELLAQVAEEIRLPAFAIGGITTDNLESVLETGIGRVAVSGAVSSTSDPGSAAQAFLQRLTPARQEPG